jgi:phage gp36-like protein
MYCTQDDLTQRYGEDEVLLWQTDRNGDGSPDDGVIEQAIADAVGLIDAYIGKRVALPLPSVPDSLRQAACSIVRYRINAENATDRIRADYDDAMRFLRDLADGRASLGLIEEEEAAVTAPGMVVKSRPRIFTDSLLARMP